VVAIVVLLAPAIAQVTYIAKSGDTFTTLAEQFNVPAEKIAAANDLKVDAKLSAGQKLTIPDAEEAQAEETPKPDDSAEAKRPLTGRELYEERARLLEQQRKQQGQSIVTAATKFRGTPYRYGGLSSRGIDCSGLVVRAMMLNGKKVPHSSAALARMGTKVTYKELQPGDLVFFKTGRRGGGISHVGIWVGNNQFIHASSGRGVITSTLDGYYAKRLVCARRLH
jgi:probable lipoprotein NlpC